MRIVYWAVGVAVLLLSSCVGKPEGIKPVESFELERYLGKWYEIARLDHRFEKGLTQVTATYSMNKNGSVKVINRGFKASENTWNEAEGKAKFVDSSDTGFLKVSFFGPFYGSYIVFELDDDYQYAFVAGPNTDYLWLLARQPTVPEELLQLFLRRAKALGFATEQLIYVDQQRPH